MTSDSKKRRFSWRGCRKISAKLPILHALRHVCGIGGHTRTEKCLWRFSLQMHSNDPNACRKVWDTYYFKNKNIPEHSRRLFERHKCNEIEQLSSFGNNPCHNFLLFFSVLTGLFQNTAISFKEKFSLNSQQLK